uniref:Serpin domain-containing protein n=1 Tax=Amphiprion ocellaris TaxID=80972 RepID=A0AAQ5Y0X0_AMPOC
RLLRPVHDGRRQPEQEEEGRLLDGHTRLGGHGYPGQLRTGSDQRYTVLELPFLGRSLSLQVVLPSERKTLLSSLEAQLTQRHLASWDTGLRRTRMDIFLPRFRMQNKFNLRSVLPAMGISDAFNPTAADFTGISVEEGLYVSDAFHEVRIEVTEDGTKAAAATGDNMIDINTTNRY